LKEQPVIDHVSIAVRNLDTARPLYDAVLAPLGLVRLVDREGTIGYGKRYPEFWLNSRPELIPTQNPGTHICLRASSESAVEQFHANALKGGASDEGAPGLRKAAVTTYFGAFFIDPDGNKLEAVTFPPVPVD
jgi:catechol 2,3-dioxygenase-like lactoylglutathione lyase family enzyme